MLQNKIKTTMQYWNNHVQTNQVFNKKIIT